MTIYDLRTPRGAPALLEARDDTSDLSVIGSTFAGVAGSGLVDEYHLAGLRLRGRFVDVGAHVGSVTVAVLLDNPDATASCVEPIPENVAVLRHNLALNGLTDRAEVIEAAVGFAKLYYGYRGSEHLVTNRYIANSTGEVFGKRQKATALAVREIALDDLLPCDAMKLDCEGGEWALLADPRIGEVPILFGEYHYGEGAEGVRRLLEQTHDVSFDVVGEIAGNFRAVAW